MESLFSPLKTERMRTKIYRTRDNAKADVFDYIERFWNTDRRQSTIGYLSPLWPRGLWRGWQRRGGRLSGVNVRRLKYKVYALSGTLAAFAGIVLMARVNSGQPKGGEGYELDIITAVVLGGVSIFGGVGRLTGVLAGALIMGVLANGMILMNIDEYVQWVVKGTVLLAAVALDQFIYRQGKSG